MHPGPESDLIEAITRRKNSLDSGKMVSSASASGRQLDDPFQGISAMSETETSDFTSETPVSENRPLPKASAGSALPYMEASIASIEAHVDHMRDDLGDMRRDYRELTKSILSAGTDMRELDDRMGHLPGKGWMFTIMLLFTAIICAVIIYLDQIRDYLGIIPPTSPL